MHGDRYGPLPVRAIVMRARDVFVGLTFTLLFLGCAAEKRGEPGAPAQTTAAAATGETTATVSAPFIESGFLTADYAKLTPVRSGAARRTYENADLSLSKYDELFIDRITLWRDADDTEAVESEDFQTVADDLHAVASEELGKHFALAKGPGSDVARLRVALVAIDDPDDQLDIYVTHGEPSAPPSDEPLPPGLREFGREAWVEAEIVDGATGEVVFAVVDRAADVIPRARPIVTWRDLHDAFVAWADQAADRIAEQRKAPR
jgi:hypothetical protein